MELECLKELLKREPIVKIVNELPDKNTADLNYIYIIPKEGDGKDKKAYVLRPDRSGFDTIDLTPQLVNVVGEGHITVEKDTLNENGDVTFTVTTSSSLQAVLDSLSAKDSEQDTRLAVHDTDISNLKVKDSEINTTLETLGTSVGKVTELVESKAQGLDTRVKALEAKEDSDKQTLAVNGNKLSISNGNEVDLPQYDDTELNDALDDLEDKLDDVRDELEESKENIKQANDYTEQVKNYLEGKVNANKDAIDANKVDADAKNNALTTRVNVLEEAKPVVENKLTEIEAKNTAQDEKITALENRTDNFINNVSVSKADGKVKLTYSRVDGSSSEVEFEDSDTVTLAYDDEPLKTRIKALEDKEDKDTIYNDTEVKQGIKANENAIQGVESDLTALRTHTDARIEALENKEDKDTIYDDSAVRGQITALESKVDGNKTVQDGKNTELENRIQALEVKPDKDTVYDDSALTNRVQALENKEDKDTVYDDTAIVGRVTALETTVPANKQAQDEKNTELDAKDKELEGKITALENKVDNDNQTLTLDDHTLSISGGNAVTLPKYDDSALKASVEELKAKDTELANKDKELTDEINTLKAKTDNFVSGVSVNKEGNKVKLTYSYIDGSNKEVEFEDSDTVTLAYDDTSVKERLTALESKEDKDTIYNDAEIKAQVQAVDTKADNNKQAQDTKNTELENRIGALESKEDKDTIYDDSALKAKVSELTDKDTALEGRISALENKPDKDTVYDDTDVKARISALETKPDKDTVYDDTALAGRVSALEAKEDKDTVYNDAELRGKVEALETKDTELAKSIADNKSDADTRLQALEAKEDSDKQTLSLIDHTLSISNGNSVELPKYDDTVVKAKNTKQDEEIKALKEKTKSFLTGASVTRQDNVVTLTYTNIDGTSTNLEFNDNDTKAIAYDDTALKARVQDLENRADNDTIYNDAPIKERLNALETKVDKDTVYDDAPLKERITALENKADKDTVYDDSAVIARLTSLETKEDKDTHYNVKSTTDGVTVVKSQENGEEVFTINADLAFKKHYTKDEVDKAIADNNKRTQKLVKYKATWKNPEYFKYTSDDRVPVLSHNNVTSFGNMKLDGVILKPMSANTIICEFPSNTPKPIEFIEVQAYIGNEPISMWYSDRTVRITDVPQSLVGKRVIFNFVGLFA